MSDLDPREDFFCKLGKRLRASLISERIKERRKAVLAVLVVEECPEW
jgi:hypothetical protein